MDVLFKTDKSTFLFRVAGILIKDGYILLHKDINDDFWSLPGGKVNIAEESQLSIQREFLEELGVIVKVDRLIWTVENFFNYNSNAYHEIGLYYKVLSDDSLFTTESFNGIEGERLIYKWTPIEELDNLALYPEFLKAELKSVPKHPKHIVVKQ